MAAALIDRLTGQRLAMSVTRPVSGQYVRNLTTASGDVTLRVPRLKGISFETATIERYRCREGSAEEALIEIYLTGASVRRVKDIDETSWGNKGSPAAM